MQHPVGQTGGAALRRVLVSWRYVGVEGGRADGRADDTISLFLPLQPALFSSSSSRPPESPSSPVAVVYFFSATTEGGRGTDISLSLSFSPNVSNQ